ncbi:cilia- and flagella-associated protein 58-like [Synchiropus picturatus]
MEPAQAAVAEMMDETMEEFQRVLDELAMDRDNSDIYLQYERLFNALKKSHANEKRLMTNSRELNELLSVKVDIAVQMSKDYEKSFFFLREELDKAWKMIEASHNTEKKDRETIRNLKEEVAGLTKQVEDKSSQALEKSLSNLLEINQELTHERDVLLRNVDELQEKISIATVTLQKVKAERDNAYKRVPELEKEMLVVQDRISQELNWREHQDKELEQLQEDNSKLKQECEQLVSVKEELTLENQQSAKQLKMREEDMIHLRQEIAKQIKLREEVQATLCEMEDHRIDVQVQKETNRALVARLEKDLESSHKQVESERLEVEELKREKESMMKSLAEQKNCLSFLEMDKSALKEEMHSIRREEVKQRQIIQQLEEECDRYISEKNNLTQQAGHAFLFIYLFFFISLKDLSGASIAMRGFFFSPQIREKITAMEVKDAEIQSWKTKVSQQERHLEGVTSEKNLYSQNLKEAQEELRVVNMLLEQTKQHACRLKAELRAEQKAERKAEIRAAQKAEKQLQRKTVQQVQHKPEQQAEHKTVQISQHNAEQQAEHKTVQISQHNAEQQAEHKAQQRVQHKPVQEARHHVGQHAEEKAEQQEEEAEENIEYNAGHPDEENAEHKLEETMEGNYIMDSDVDDDKMQESLDEFFGERDTLLSMLQCRNEERALLYDKIKIHQSMLKKGMVHLKRQMEDIRLLKLEILNQQNTRADEKVPNSEQDLRRELVHKEKELLRERTRNTELREQLNSINCHRWRRLEDSDPEKYELIQKIQGLQKRLITKTQEIDKQCNLLQEKDKLYVELKQVLSRKPGPETVEQLNQLRWSLKDKTKKVQTLTQELKMLESRIDAYKIENQKLTAELQSFKKKNAGKMKRDK